ncbi:MAG: hypothetical protein ABEJ22_07690 [Haloferacaceae archaeon]
MTDEESTLDEGRYAVLDDGNGDVVIYDTENPEAWIASDTTMANWSRERKPPSNRG